MMPDPIRAAVPILLLCMAVPLFAGATGEEDLGSEELPVVWGMVFENGIPEPIDDMKRFLVPIELETGYFSDILILDSYDELFVALEERRVHCVLLPPLTFLVAQRDGLVEAGVVSREDSREETLHVGSLVIAGADFDPETMKTGPAQSGGSLRVARYDRHSQDGWLTARLVLEASGLTGSGIEIVGAVSYGEVIAAVNSGDADIGILPKAYTEVYTESGEPLGTIIGELESVSGWGLHFSPVVSGIMKSRIVSSLEERAADPQSLGFLHTRFAWNTVSAVDEDYILSLQALLAAAGVDRAFLP